MKSAYFNLQDRVNRGIAMNDAELVFFNEISNFATLKNMATPMSQGSSVAQKCPNIVCIVRYGAKAMSRM